ncbi:uncharacterized protein LOC110818784 [Carica papaya]|uniref:uncharacterized protein LOC110818784 n=1 Tax=Carica papaya TaxID=3649 RepID=UPI000B8CF5A0|nr:uncharacterized protein LOC110818784 [Carica papaya]
MGSSDRKTLDGEGTSSPSPQPPQPRPAPSFSENWQERILTPTLLAGIAGGGVGLISKYRKAHGLANISATYAANFTIVTGCYCGAREFVRVTRKSEHDDLLNSAIGGFGTGAILGRLQGGRLGAYRYSVMFAVVGTAVDFAILRLKPVLRNFQDGDWFKLPNWSPIQVLDEEALAAKKAREQKLYPERAFRNLSKEES